MSLPVKKKRERQQTPEDILREMDRCIQHREIDKLQQMLSENGNDLNLNFMMPELRPHFGITAHTLLYTAVKECRMEAVALLMLHRADPLEDAVIYKNDRSKEEPTYSTNVLDVCVLHLHSQPLNGVFLLRLLDTRPVCPVIKMNCQAQSLGRNVNANLAHPDLDREGAYAERITALEYACDMLWVNCVHWLLFGRHADPNFAEGGLEGLLERLNSRRVMIVEDEEKVQEIQNLLLSSQRSCE